MHGESDVTTAIMNLYLPNIPAFANENPAVGQEVHRLYQKGHCMQNSFLF